MMNNMDNLHAGHRERMTEKFLRDPSGTPEHELLEMLLFPVIPRKDTNATAHKLLRAFGNIYNVLNATPGQLTSVEGIGKKTAASLSLVGTILKRITSEYPKRNAKPCYSFATYKSEIINRFNGLETENFIIFLFDAKKNLITSLSFEDKNRYQVKADIPEIASAFAIHKPTYALIAHNHTSGSIEPSETDDLTTVKLHLLCAVHGVTLLDHIIVCRNNALSYFLEGKLDEITKDYNLDTIIKQIKEK